MNDLMPCLCVHAWFWLVAGLSISIQRAPLQSFACLIAVAVMAVGVYSLWPTKD